MSAATLPTSSSASIFPAAALLAHWQGHRRLTRRVIEAFPEKELLEFSVGNMRPFGALAMELISIGEPMMQGFVTGQWNKLDHPAPESKAAILTLWDAATESIDRLWSAFPSERFDETQTAFGMYPGKVYDLLFYAIDNEIHHRGQGYVYLRALGIAPPPFWERE